MQNNGSEWQHHITTAITMLSDCVQKNQLSDMYDMYEHSRAQPAGHYFHFTE